MQPFYERATKGRDVQAGTLCVKILERRALLLGLDSPTRVDVVQTQARQAPSSYERITDVLMNLKYGPSGNGDGAAAPSDHPAPSDADDADPNR